MRVALLSANARGGDAIGRQLAEKVAFFTDHGADVRVFVADDRHLHPLLSRYCRRIDQPRPEGDSWPFLASADLVIVEYSQDYRLLEFLPFLAGLKLRIVFDYHGVTPVELWGSANAEGVEQGVCNRGLVWFADAAIIHSRFAAEELLGPTGYPRDRVRQLGYPIDAAESTLPPGTLRRRLGLLGATILLFVGRAAVNKRLGLLVDALAELRQQTPPVHAVIVGDTSDVYQLEADRCRERAAELQVADRLHFLGHVDDDTLRDAYRCADVFVMPSVHESFCLPVLEAMARGVPVVAARAAALPETVASAGLTFAPDDPHDLIRQVQKVLAGERNPAVPVPSPASYRVAIVSTHFGGHFPGGAETSLTTIAGALQGAGHHVEVFTTCCRDENDWRDLLAEGTSKIDGLTVHRFRIDPRDPERYRKTQEQIEESTAPETAGVEEDYLAHSLRSSRLIEALRRRIDAFDAIIAGPYLFGLTHDVAREFPEKTLILPCFHDEPAARLPRLLEVYRSSGGLLYHTPEEQQFAERELGVNHPRGVCTGTWVAGQPSGNADRGRALVGGSRRYVLYVGRYSPHKNLPLLLDHAGRYAGEHPDRFTFAFIGQGEMTIPDAPWIEDLGFVDDRSRQDLIAGASAVVQLSCRESLSLAVLQAWSEGVPVIVSQKSEVLRGQVERSRGGRVVCDYPSFAAVLDELWERPEQGRQLGRQGLEYVRRQYGDRQSFLAGLVEAIASLQQPLTAAMRQRGVKHAERFARSAWREQFAAIIDDLLHRDEYRAGWRAVVEPRSEYREVPLGSREVQAAVRIHNRGGWPLVADGPGRVVVRAEVVDQDGRPINQHSAAVLPGMVLPGRTMPAAVTVPVPDRAGTFEIVFRVEPAEFSEHLTGNGQSFVSVPARTHLRVEHASQRPPAGMLGGVLDMIHEALAEAERLGKLPDDYADITEGWLATWKKRIKSKLLNNFKRGYVDVLSRRQSSFNRQVLTVLEELVECCATLEHAHHARPHSDLADELVRTRQRCEQLEQRLARLEALLLAREVIIT